VAVQGPAFDLESKQAAGRVFSWLGSLFAPKNPLGGPIAAMGPSLEAVGRSALFNLLSTNPDVVGTVIDQCFSSEPALARGHFQACPFPTN
jgi:Cell morphogenesis central region